MRKLIAVAILVAFGFMLGSNGAVMAQKQHAPKAVWKGMVASLNDIQSITAALAVFDMERATMIADGLVKERGSSRLSSDSPRQSERDMLRSPTSRRSSPRRQGRAMNKKSP